MLKLILWRTQNKLHTNSNSGSFNRFGYFGISFGNVEFLGFNELDIILQYRSSCSVETFDSLSLNVDHILKQNYFEANKFVVSTR